MINEYDKLMDTCHWIMALLIVFTIFFYCLIAETRFSASIWYPEGIIQLPLTSFFLSKCYCRGSYSILLLIAFKETRAGGDTGG
jgi:hypothetical protein